MNKTHYKSLVAAAILTGLTQQAAMATELDPIGSAQDTWVRSPTDPDKQAVFANKNFMKIDRTYTAFVQFVIPALPEGEVIDSVILKLTAKTAIPDTYIATVTVPDVVWDETVVNELVYPFVVDSIIPGTPITGIGAGDVKDFDITDAVSGAGTYTFNIDMEDTDAGNISWVSGIIGSGNAQRPHLFITTKPALDSDTTKPVFADITPIEINATGTKTDISSSINITATDDTDGDIAATVVGETSLISGAHTITLQATDVAGNQATKDVTVNITPLVVLTQPETLELPAGETASVSVALSGPAVSYPASIDYTVAGDATNDISDTLSFTAENYTDAQSVDMVIKADAEGGQAAILTLAATSNVQASEETVTVTAFDGNIAPHVTLTLTQAEKIIATISASNADTIPYIDATKGDVTVTVEVADFNDEDTHALDWTKTSEVLAATGTSFVFSPAELAGNFTLSINATESNTTEKFSALLKAQIKVIATALPELVADVDTDGDGINDIDEGFKDSDGDGIVDYLDGEPDTTKLPLAAEQKPLQTLPSLTLSLGSIASTQGLAASSAVITLQDLADNVAPDSADTTDTGFLPIEGASLFNFTINGVANGATAPVVYPLPKDVVIGADTEYRKYTSANGWVKFVSDADNAIASTAKDETGNCPAPNDALYIDGLTAGDNCIQLTIKDGGIYDADGEENGSIEDPGVLAESYSVIAWSTDTIALPATNVNEGSSVTLTKDLTTLVGDADVSALTFAVEGNASWLSIDEEGILSADVSKLATGEHTANVSFTSENGQTGTTKVSVSVVFNNAPTLAAVELATASRNEAYSASIAESITDANGDTFTVSKVSGPYWLKVSETGELSGTPLKADIGDNNITVELADDKGATSEVSFNVAVSDSSVRASDAGSFSAGLLAILGLVSLRRRKAQK
jgi:Putative Ig domain